MGALVGLGVGIGLFLVWSAFQVPRANGVTRRHGPGLEELLARAGMGGVSVTSLSTLCGVVGLTAFLVVLVVSSTFPVALSFGVIAGYLPVLLVRRQARVRQQEFSLVWPDAVDNLCSAVRAGMSLPDALAALSQTGPEPLRPAFAQFALDHQVSGRFSDSLDRLKDRLADPVGDRMVEGLRVAREVGGGDLGRLLRNLSHYLRDDARTRAELHARQAWTVSGARLAVAAPWLVLLFMSFQSEVITRYSSATGTLVLMVGAAACFGAYTAMVRIGRLPVERRILS